MLTEESELNIQCMHEFCLLNTSVCLENYLISAHDSFSLTIWMHASTLAH